MKTTIAVIGECMAELSIKPDSTTCQFGGDTLNTAVYLSRLLNRNAFEVHYITALGTDPFSQEMLQYCYNEHVQTNLVQQLENKFPGLCSIFTDSAGECSFHYWRDMSAARMWLDTTESSQICNALLNFNYVYLSGISLAILDDQSRQILWSVLAEIKALGGQIIFDNNYDPHLWSSLEQTREAYTKTLSLSDIALLTLNDENALWGAAPYEHAIIRSKQLGVKEIVIKRGSNSYIIDTDESRFMVPAKGIKENHIIDTLASKESFGAGYLAGRFMGKCPTLSAKQGHWLVGTVIQYHGAVIPKNAMLDVLN